jgi:pimeloyl-ACP methyl ester carboxylesterase
MRHVLYLHGFASSAQSKKASFFADRFAALGIPLQCPDFNEPDFEHLTVSRMRRQVEERIARLPSAPVALIGSSLGGFVALHTAACWKDGAPPIDRLVLLAPALDFGGNRMTELGPERLARWKETDSLDVFHYGAGEMRQVRYGLYEDAGLYDSFTCELTTPTLIFHGRHDASVDPAMVERFARGRPHVTLHMLDDDHQLLGSLEFIWKKMARFLRIGT